MYKSKGNETLRIPEFYFYTPLQGEGILYANMREWGSSQWGRYFTQSNSVAACGAFIRRTSSTYPYAAILAFSTPWYYGQNVGRTFPSYPTAMPYQADSYTYDNRTVYYAIAESSNIESADNFSLNQGAFLYQENLDESSIVLTPDIPGNTIQKIAWVMIYGESSGEVTPYDIPASETGGGDGTYDFQDSDPIDFPTLPSLSAVATGFVSLWSPTEQQMLDLSSFMWNADITTIDFWKKLFADPKELIFGLSLVPLNLADLGYIDGQGTVVVGLVNTRIMMDKVSSQWVEFDCGSLNIDEAWGAYLDYDPYTKLEIYLPFCGVHPIKVDDFTPGTISLKYYIDLLSGTCVAMVKSTKSNKHGDVLDSIMYQFMGNCAAQIPVSSQQFADAVRSAISIAASIGTMVATGVGGAAAMTAAKSAGAGLATAMRTVSSEISTGASAVENVMNIKPSIERSGAIGSTAALLGVRTPYLILTRPRMARPDSQSTYTGYPSFITETLGDISGWTIVQAIHLEAIPCTAEEMSEIDELLKGGVIL